MTTQAKRYEMYTVAKNMISGVAMLEWMEHALYSLIKQEDEVRSHFSRNTGRYCVSQTHKLDGNLGICTYLKPHWLDRDTHTGVSLMLSIVWEGHMYPIKVAGDSRTAAHLFQVATPRGMWSKGKYADARWAEVKQLHIAVKSVLNSFDK